MDSMISSLSISSAMASNVSRALFRIGETKFLEEPVCVHEPTPLRSWREALTDFLSENGVSQFLDIGEIVKAFNGL